jgi:hypothetical protein
MYVCMNVCKYVRLYVCMFCIHDGKHTEARDVSQLRHSGYLSFLQIRDIITIPEIWEIL